MSDFNKEDISANDLFDRYAVIAACSFLIIHAFGLPYFLSATGIFPISIMYWAILQIILCAPLLLMKRSWPFVKAPLFIFSVAYVVLAIVGYMYSSRTSYNWQALVNILIAMTFLATMVISFGAVTKKRYLYLALWLVVVISICLNLLEFFLPYLYNGSSIPGPDQSLARSAGTLLNPNISSAFLSLAMMLSFMVLNTKYRIYWMVLCFVGVFLTFSRSGMIMWLIAFIGHAVIRHVSWKDWSKGLVFSGATVLTLFLIFRFMFYAPYQLPWYAHPEITHEQFYDNSFARFVDLQTAGHRFTGARITAELLSRSLWKGGGTGASYEVIYDAELLAKLGYKDTDPVGAHNIYLTNMADYGLLGILIFPGFILLTMIRNRRFMFNEINVVCALMLIFAGLFSHNMLEQGWVFVIAILISLTNNIRESVDLKYFRGIQE